MKNHMLLMMGGKGTRLGADRPKQYVEVHGVPVFAYIVKKCGEVENIDRIVNKYEGEILYQVLQNHFQVSITLFNNVDV